MPPHGVKIWSQDIIFLIVYPSVKGINTLLPTPSDKVDFGSSSADKTNTGTLDKPLSNEIPTSDSDKDNKTSTGTLDKPYLDFYF
ncbi:hypothetical protein DEO72_LG8g2400 [Vigna unguiculata]|uniref:Uncharacterized protein n=1 Tax=Vigna unguiculata TaxID=3917 RepID=A0A4D6MUD7_VIGUN|nr:hypothetical protein DEO72_LG8g2400 [Vigna unguiculata]